MDRFMNFKINDIEKSDLKSTKNKQDPRFLDH